MACLQCETGLLSASIPHVQDRVLGGRLQLFFTQRLSQLFSYPSQVLYVDLSPSLVVEQPERSFDLFHGISSEDMSGH